MNQANLKMLTDFFESKKSTPKSTFFTDDALSPPLPIRVEPKSISYVSRHRGEYFKPEYDFAEISIIQDKDSYVARSIQQKVNKIMVAGWDFVGNNEETVDYIYKRILESSYATNKPFPLLMQESLADLFRFNNCIWAKVRNEEASSGEPLPTGTGSFLTPIAGYYILPMETLDFKTKINGELLKVQQIVGERKKEWSAKNIVHFYSNRKPGFLVGTPDIIPVIDDITLFREIEDNVKDLIDTNLFPVYHYKIGTDEFPERTLEDGKRESDYVRKTLSYMPASGIYISNHRHQIEAIGAEGRALRIDLYLNHFKNRVLAGLGTSSLDMGEGDTATRSTASTMSKGMLMNIEAIAVVFKAIFEFSVITELLIEGGFDPLDRDQMVHLKFGVIDKEERRADENQQIQMFTNNLRTIDEVRKNNGDAPWTESHSDRTHYKMYEEANNLVKAMGPGSAASEALAAHPSSNITPANVKKETETAIRMEKAKAAGRPSAKKVSSGARSTSASRSRPSNQHGTRSGPKTNRDFDFENYLNTCDFEWDSDKVQEWKDFVLLKWEESNCSISLQTLADVSNWRIRR